MKGLIVSVVLVLVMVAGYAWGDATTKDAGGSTDAEVNIGFQLNDNPIGLGGFVDQSVNIFPEQTQQALIRALAPVAKETLNVQPDAIKGYLHVSASSWTSDRVVSLKINVSLDGNARPAAVAFLQKAVDTLPAVLDQMEQEGIAHVQKQITDQQHANADELSDSQNTEMQCVQDLFGMGFSDTDPKGIQALAQKLDEENEQATIDRAARQARGDELAKAIHQLTQDSDLKSQNDPLAQELETIVKLKDDRIKLLKQGMATGVVTPYDMDDAETQAAGAQVQLLERREAVAKAAGSGDLLADLQRQLIELQIDGADGDARYHKMFDLSGSLRDAENRANTIQACKEKETACEARLAGLNDQLRKLDAFVANRQLPVVTVLNDDPNGSPFTSPVTK